MGSGVSSGQLVSTVTSLNPGAKDTTEEGALRANQALDVAVLVYLGSVVPLCL